MDNLEEAGLGLPALSTDSGVLLKLVNFLRRQVTSCKKSGQFLKMCMFDQRHTRPFCLQVPVAGSNCAVSRKIMKT